MADFDHAEDIEIGNLESSCCGVELRFTNLQYRVTTRNGSKEHILKGISGACIPGRFFALMGASGLKESATCITRWYNTRV